MNKLLLLILSLLLLSFVPLSANATYVYENKDGEYSTDVDKFVPQSGVKIKTSKLANMMENGTRNAMDGNNAQRQQQMPNQSQMHKQQRTSGRSYKWF